MNEATTAEQSARVRALITAGWRTRLIHAGVRAGLVDALGDRPRSAGECARELGLQEEISFRVLRALATFGLCEHVAERDFVLTPLGARLRSDAPQSMRGLALHWGGRTLASLETIAATLESGEPGWGGGDFAGLLADPVESDIFYRAMAEQSKPVAKALAQAVDFSGFARLMDVGGGYGAVLVEILHAHPALTGRIYDLAGIAEGAGRMVADSGLGDRVDFVPGSFFERVPPGADCILLKFILHDWSDEEVATIMRNCRDALAPGARLVIVEKILPELVGPQDESVVRSDLVMMPINGKERTLAEYRAIAEQADFAFVRATALVDDCHAIEIDAV